MVAAAAEAAPGARGDDVPVRNRAVLLCGIGLAALTLAAVLAGTLVALLR
jgi:hypothetical protein